MRSTPHLLLALSSACASAGGRATSKAAAPPVTAAESLSVSRAQYPSTYRRHAHPPVVIRNATIMTATGREIPNGAISFKDGRIVAVGTTPMITTTLMVVVCQ